MAADRLLATTKFATLSVMGGDENPPIQGTDSVQPVPLKRKLPTSLVAAAEDQAHAARLARLRSSRNASSSQPDCDECNSSTRGHPLFAAGLYANEVHLLSNQQASHLQTRTGRHVRCVARAAEEVIKFREA